MRSLVNDESEREKNKNNEYIREKEITLIYIICCFVFLFCRSYPSPVQNGSAMNCSGTQGNNYYFIYSIFIFFSKIRIVLKKIFCKKKKKNCQRAFLRCALLYIFMYFYEYIVRIYREAKISQSWFTA